MEPKYLIYIERVRMLDEVLPVFQEGFFTQSSVNYQETHGFRLSPTKDLVYSSSELIQITTRLSTDKEWLLRKVNIERVC